MSDLAEFLLARIAEDEEAARRAEGKTWQNRAVYRHPTSPQEIYGDDGTVVAGEVDYLAGQHIARHDPARVLAECEAKRRILELHRPQGDGTVCSVCCWGEDDGALYELVPCPTLRLLAVPFASHPDYDEEWRPE